MNDATSMIHLAGVAITIGNERVIQRCSLCGAVLVDVVASNCAEFGSVGEFKQLIAERVSRWQCGELVEVDAGNPTRSGIYKPVEEDKLPDNTCIFVL